MILVVNTNTNDCRIYHYDKHPAQLTLIKQISHPDNKLKISELTSDRSGHYKATQARGAYSPQTNAKEVEIINFSREIAQDLNHRRNSKELEFKRLILIAPPYMYGLISQQLNKHVMDLVTNRIQKDLMYMKEHELLDYLKENAQFTG